MNVKTKKCLMCSNDFKVKRERNLTCGITCRNRYLNKNFVKDIIKKKDEDLRLGSLHDWVRDRIRPRGKCENCLTADAYDLANKGVYNRDLDNWKWLCRKCHMTEDGRLDKMIEFGHKSKLPKKVCRFCKKEFQPKKNSRVFCGYKCSNMFLANERWV